MFEYTRPSDGATFVGQVQYSGFGINNLVLRIDPETGEGFLVNESPFTIDIDGYSIVSDSGALQPGGWNSLETQGVDDWRADSDSGQLSELNPLGATTLETGTTFDLGMLFDPSGARDLALEYVFPGDFVPRLGAVEYELAPPPMGGLAGDYNDDGKVNAADYTVWRDTLGSMTDLRADGNADGTINQGDYDFWKTNFGEMAAGSSQTAVPEPATFLMAIVALGHIGLRRPRRSDDVAGH